MEAVRRPVDPAAPLCTPALCTPAKAGVQVGTRYPGLPPSREHGQGARERGEGAREHGEGAGEGEAFAVSAERLAGFAGAFLGWSPDAFWRATPAELLTLVRALGGGAEEAVPPDAALVAAMRERFPDG